MLLRSEIPNGSTENRPTDIRKDEYMSVDSQEKKEIIFIVRGHDNVKATIEVGKQKPEKQEKSKLWTLIKELLIRTVSTGIVEVFKWFLVQ